MALHVAKKKRKKKNGEKYPESRKAHTHTNRQHFLNVKDRPRNMTEVCSLHGNVATKTPWKMFSGDVKRRRGWYAWTCSSSQPLMLLAYSCQFVAFVEIFSCQSFPFGLEKPPLAPLAARVYVAGRCAFWLYIWLLCLVVDGMSKWVYCPPIQMKLNRLKSF